MANDNKPREQASEKCEKYESSKVIDFIKRIS